ncbi:GWxTD domain-containing protein, partial [Gemmatimonadota bacterium]
RIRALMLPQAFLKHARRFTDPLLPTRLLVLLLPVLLAHPTITACQEVVAPSIAGPDFHASVITFQSDQGIGKTQVEIYVSIAYDQLYFVRAEGTFRAEYDLNLVLLGPRGETVFDETTRSQTTTPILEETLSDEILRMQRFTFIVEPGIYDLIVSLLDHQVEDPRELGFTIEVPSYSENRLGISDILLADFLGESDLSLPAGAVVDYSGSQLFVRQGHAYIPNTRGLYANFAPSVLAYYEVYGFNPVRRTEQDRLYRVEFYVLNDTGETAIYYMRRHDKPGSSAFNSVEMNIQDLTPGKYSLKIDITDMGSGMTVSNEREFTVLESYLSLAFQDFEKAVNQLRYIASERELRLLRTAPEERRLAFFKQFWISRDPTPGTKRNEVMLEYYRRVAFANEQFDVPQLDGWATDRGMVYLSLGLPDYVDRSEFSTGSNPAQIWVYNSMRLHLLFEDDSGFGDFTLINRDDFRERVQERIPPER